MSDARRGRSAARIPDDARAAMRLIEGGSFRLGSNRFYPEEAPVRTTRVASFLIDRAPVTNADFARFVAATGHVTVAETAPDPRDYPDIDAAALCAGSLVFERTAGPVPLDDPGAWWAFREGADWRHPCGPDSSIAGLDLHPVVHVAYADAEAYAAWAGKALPTEAEWEVAARGGRVDDDYAWGDRLAPDGRMMANYWQGLFPFANQLLDGYERTSPVGAFPANGYGLHDMIGNVWEWTADWYAPAKGRGSGRGGCCPGRRDDGGHPAAPARSKVVKGGSYLCAENHCQRYRPAARQPQTVDTSTGHIGFRCVVRDV